MEVQLANSAAEALEVLGRLMPDLLISDIGMPDEDGYSLLRKVRALPPERGDGFPSLPSQPTPQTLTASERWPPDFNFTSANPSS